MSPKLGPLGLAWKRGDRSQWVASPFPSVYSSKERNSGIYSSEDPEDNLGAGNGIKRRTETLAEKQNQQDL